MCTVECSRRHSMIILSGSRAMKWWHNIHSTPIAVAQLHAHTFTPFFRSFKFNVGKNAIHCSSLQYLHEFLFVSETQFFGFSICLVWLCDTNLLCWWCHPHHAFCALCFGPVNPNSRSFIFNLTTTTTAQTTMEMLLLAFFVWRFRIIRIAHDFDLIYLSSDD